MLLPVPAAILELGPNDPAALAWLMQHWGTTDRLRQVVRRPQPGIGRRLPAGHAVMGYGFFTAGDTPLVAIERIAPIGRPCSSASRRVRRTDPSAWTAAARSWMIKWTAWGCTAGAADQAPSEAAGQGTPRLVLDGMRPVRLSGTEKQHKAIQKSHAEVGFLSGLRPPSKTVSGSEKSYRPRKLRWRQISGERWAMSSFLTSMPSCLTWRMASCM